MLKKIIHLINKTRYVIKKKIEEIVKKRKFGSLYTEDQLHLFNFLKEGDIVFSHMPLGYGKMYDIPEGHKSRPYLIVKKTKNHIYAHQSSSSKRKSLSSIKRFDILSSDPKEGFNISYKAITNDSYFDLSKLYKLEKHHLIEFFFRITKEQKKELYRKLLCLKDNGEDIILFDYNYKIEIGDVVKYKKQYYYVFSKSIDRYVLYPIKEDSQLFRPIKMNIKNKKYELDPYAVLNLNIKTKLTRVYSIYAENINSINNHILKVRKNKQIKKNYTKNDVIKIKLSDKKYIVKEDIGDVVLSFELHYRKNKNMIRCKYKDKKVYYDDSKTKQIQKNSIKSYEGVALDG